MINTLQTDQYNVNLTKGIASYRTHAYVRQYSKHFMTYFYVDDL